MENNQPMNDMPEGQDWERELNWLIDSSIKQSQERQASSVVVDSEMSAKTDDSVKSNDADDIVKQSPNLLQDPVTSVSTSDDDNTGYYNDYESYNDDDDDDDGLTPEQRKLLQRNTFLNDAEEGEEYDVQVRLRKANQALASEHVDDGDRERKVLFKHKLVDFEAPPCDLSSSSSDNEPKVNDISKDMDELNLQSPESEAVEINGQLLQKKEKVLIERGGKFELVEVGELHDILPSNMWMNGRQPQTEQHDTATLLPEIKRRPKSAPAKHYSLQPSEKHFGTPTTMVSKRPFSYSPQMKELMRKQAAARAEREKEEEARALAERETNRQEAESAWKHWLDKKNEAMRRQRKQSNKESHKKELMLHKDPEEAEEAYKSWLKQKRIQTKKEKLMIQQHQMEMDEGWCLRGRKDCNKAFQRWLQNKNETARKAKAEEKKIYQQSIRELKQAKKIQRLMSSIREAQQMKYIEYYGYRI